MSLQGSFGTIALRDVMALLASSNKSGELRVVGGHVEGRLWIEDGRLVASSVGKSHDHVDVMFELLRLTEGNFVFKDGVEAPAHEDTGGTPVEPVVREAEERLKEWHDIEMVVPSLEHRVRLIPDLPSPEVTLSAGEWRLVMSVALAATVRGAIEEVDLGEFEGCRGIRQLVDAGLVIVEPPRVRPSASDPARVARRAAPTADDGSGAARVTRRRLAPPLATTPSVGPAVPGESLESLAALAAAAAADAVPDPVPTAVDDFQMDYDELDELGIVHPFAMTEQEMEEQDVALPFAVGGDSSAPSPFVFPATGDPGPDALRGFRARRQAMARQSEEMVPVTAATQSAASDTEAAVERDSGTDAINRGLLLKFLSSVRS